MYAQDEVNQAESKQELTERRGELIPQVMHSDLMRKIQIRYDTIEEFNVDSKDEYRPTA